MKLLLGYGIRGKKISGIRDTYEYRGIPDTRSIMYLGYRIPGLALWDTKIFIGIRSWEGIKDSAPPGTRSVRRHGESKMSFIQPKKATWPGVEKFPKFNLFSKRTDNPNRSFASGGSGDRPVNLASIKSGCRDSDRKWGYLSAKTLKGFERTNSRSCWNDNLLSAGRMNAWRTESERYPRNLMHVEGTNTDLFKLMK